eukprot:5266128-Alexandrium_andersonii.AAC.1
MNRWWFLECEHVAAAVAAQPCDPSPCPQRCDPSPPSRAGPTDSAIPPRPRPVRLACLPDPITHRLAS